MNDNNNNKLIIKTQFVSNELKNNENANNNTNPNNKLKQPLNEDYLYSTHRLRTSNENELLEENEEAEAEEISKMNVEFKPSISPTSSYSLQLNSFDNISSYSSISSNSSSSSSSSSRTSAKNKNLKSVVFIIDKQNQQNQLQLNQPVHENLDKTEMKSSIISDNEEMSSLADSSFSSTSNSSTLALSKTITDEITHGKVKHLRDKFDENVLTNSTNSFKRRQSETINYQLKKCQSVILNLDASMHQSTPNKFSNTITNENNTTNNTKSNLKTRAQSNNCIGDLINDEKIMIKNNNSNNENNSLIDESSVFDNCGVKERIRKFNNDFNNSNSKNENNFKLKRSLYNSTEQFNTDKNKYGGSCNNLILSTTPIKLIKQQPLITTVNITSSNNIIRNKKVSISEADASNDDSNSTFSDDLTNSDLSCTNENNFKKISLLNDNKENYFDLVHRNFTSFEENYVKIKEGFSDLKKDNLEITNLLNKLRNKVKESSMMFYDSYFVQNGLDEYSNTASIDSTLMTTTNKNENEFETISEYDDPTHLTNNLDLFSSKATNDSNSMQLYVRHKF